MNKACARMQINYTPTQFCSADPFFEVRDENKTFSKREVLHQVPFGHERFISWKTDSLSRLGLGRVIDIT